MSVYKGVSLFVKCKIENIVALKVEGIRQGARRDQSCRQGAELGKEQNLARSEAGRGVEPSVEQSQAGSGAM